MIQKNLFSRFAVVVFSGMTFVCVAGCGPRGESHTVEQILTDARSSYQSVLGQAPAETGAALKFLAASLDKVAGIGGGGEARVVAGEIATMLSELSVKAGYPSRPAMAELISQYRSIASGDSAVVSIGAPNLKLLAARTYFLVSSELKTTRFKIS